MCGFTACVALRESYSNGHSNGKSNGKNDGESNGHISPETLRTQLQSSIDLLNHRGPDESDIWISPDARVGLAHCRLSINDLTPSGRQPLHSDCGEIHAVVNGEIYDHDKLRNECTAKHGYVFSSTSDSELVIALYKIHGAPAFLEHLRGEFAFVLLDNREGSNHVVVARDRFGIKPLMWTKLNSHIVLAAEAKAFLPLGWEPEWDVGAIVDAGWMFDARTLFKGVYKVLPGHYMEITDERGVEMHCYWDAEYEDKTKIETRTIDEMVQGVRERLVEAVRLRLRADVPIGVYLSGGIDSSAIAGIATQLAREEHVKLGSQAATRVSCFSVRFPDDSGYDESSIAERTAEWLGVEVLKQDVNEASLAHDFADTAYHCEHHHFDLNCVAKFALSTLPRANGVKVVLTGEGADEHFAGYPYFPAEFLREPDLALPSSPLAANPALREGMQRAADNEMRAIWKSIGADGSGESFADSLLAWHPRATLFAPWVRASHANVDYLATLRSSYAPDVRDKMATRWHPLHTAEYMWNKNSLANVLLSCLGDRTEMAHSVEARTPFLDHHLADYVNNLPPSVKLAYTPINNDQSQEESSNHGPVWKASGKALQSLTAKWILREAVRPYITDELYRRKKHPFLAPTKWPHGGPLHCTFVQLLTRDAVDQLGFVDYAVIEHSLEIAFGDKADATAFRTLTYVAAWVVLSKRFGVKKASSNGRTY
ncbi:glutamine-hydrolyzing asparagine synthase [Dothidotthia symphoricarpi CBS 119687]|uniref:Glutamine-hydrolyzing asparagine synthase n=1 Tax=Dothidotthia symphoricarpi CBS 119687 TaxID=1392245 RepID=A0A6A6AFC0_9PLEO|nr:glutamine-hydrolyzing asparagine synthase [Dothidotthia symphoricarpi CBS 119687]KAF2129728.1 glutamine-hydrolyzing asparagine synthase [Dothidotthia symphoricarpi CBS 119687]